jgi:hypothetical protein
VRPASKALVRVRSVPADVQVNYVAGGPAANLPVRVSALVRGKALQLPATTRFSFSPPRQARSRREDDEEATATPGCARGCRQAAPHAGPQRRGQAHHRQRAARRQPRELLLEATYADPNGEVQTLRSTPRCGRPAWSPASRPRAGCRQRQKIRFQALALQH